jgi:hypothetical protein
MAYCVIATLNPDPPPIHLVRDGRRRPRSQVCVKDNIPRFGRNCEHTSNELLGLWRVEDRLVREKVEYVALRGSCRARDLRGPERLRSDAGSGIAKKLLQPRNAIAVAAKPNIAGCDSLLHAFAGVHPTSSFRRPVPAATRRS